MRRDMAQYQVRADRRDLIEPRLAELAFDVIFLGEAEAAVGLDAHIGGIPARLRREHFYHIGFGAARLARLEQRRRLIDHRRRRRNLDMRAGDRALDALLFADRPPDNPVSPSIGDGALDEKPTTRRGEKKGVGTVKT